ncbi:MAG: replication initiation protein [Nitrospirae bacterium]|nr:replication initiation protein [Nitrospirota bacterium]
MDLRKVLGISDKEYKLYGDFKRAVLLTAQTELAAKTDISFTFDEKKTGRAVTGLVFHVFTRLPEPPTDSIAAEYTIQDEYDLAVSKLQPYERDLFQRLLKTFKLSKKQAHEVVTGYLLREGQERIEELLTYCYDHWQKKLKADRTAHLGKITNKAIKEGWQVQEDLFREPIPTYVKIERPPEPTEEQRAAIRKMVAEVVEK